MTTTTYTTEVLADSPYLYWKLDETSGTTAADSSGNSRNGTYTNSPTLNQTALINEGKSVDFDGSNDHVKYTLPSNFTGNFTIECWVNNDDFSNYPGVFGAWTANSNGNYGTNVALNTNGTFDINVARNNFNFWEVNAGGYGSVSTGTRYHIALTVDDTNDLVKFYINGSQSGSSLTLTNQVGLGASGKELRVASAGAIGGFWNGKIQGFAVYSTVLSAARIAAHYNAGVNTEVNADLTNIAVDAKDADYSIISNPTVNADVTNVNIQSHLATVEIEESNTSDVTNILVQGQDATVLAERNVTITTDLSNISLEANNPILQIQSGVQIPADVTNILIQGKDATVVINITVNANVTNIALDAKEALPLYPSLIALKNPVHYFRFKETDVTVTDVIDYGSIPIFGTSYNLDPINDSIDGIPGDPQSGGIELDSVAGSSVQAITFFAQNIWNTNNLLDLNGSYEFWIKTNSPNYAIFSVDGNNTTNNKRTAYIGLINGELSLRYSITDSPESWSETRSGSYLNDNEWHHVVFTKSYNVTTQTFSYKSYVDAEETPVTISLGTWFQLNSVYGERRMIGSYGIDTSPYVATPFTSSVTLDEIAIYNITLSQQDISDHYNAGSGTYDIEIETEVADIFVEAITSGNAVTIFAESSNIDLNLNGIIVNPGNGSLTIITHAEGIDVNQTNSTLQLTGGVNVFQQTSNLNIKAGITRFRTKTSKFKFISSQDLALGSLDAEELESIDYGGLLFNQSKKLLFRIGNEDYVTASYQISITSKEDGVPNAVTLSKDNISYTSSILIEGIPPNGITDVIYAKLDVNNLDVLGNGTFLINVEQL